MAFLGDKEMSGKMGVRGGKLRTLQKGNGNKHTKPFSTFLPDQHHKFLKDTERKREE